MHKLGALLLPAPAPDSQDDSVGDPALDILGDFFATVLRHYLDLAWSDCAPGEEIVKKILKHDPEDFDFAAKDTPVLCLWREGDSSPKNLADSFVETETQLRVLWVLPPATKFKNGKRSSFFAAFDKVIGLVALHERDRSYIHPSQANPAHPSYDEAAAYGSDIFALAGIDWWKLQSVQRAPVDVEGGSQTHRFIGYLASFAIGETTVTDPTVFGTGPTVIDFDLTTGGDDPLVTHEALVPPDADEDP